jgi:hypothetical protein
VDAVLEPEHVARQAEAGDLPATVAGKLDDANASADDPVEAIRRLVLTEDLGIALERCERAGEAAALERAPADGIVVAVSEPVVPRRLLLLPRVKHCPLLPSTEMQS